MVMSTSSLSAFSLFLKAFLILFCVLKPLSQPAVLVCNTSATWQSLIKFWTSSLLWVPNTLSMWHVKDCRVRSLRLLEQETYVFSFTFSFSLQFLYWTESLRVCFLSSFFTKFWRGQIVPVALFLRDNFNCSAGLAQLRGLAQTLSDFYIFYPETWEKTNSDYRRWEEDASLKSPTFSLDFVRWGGWCSQRRVMFSKQGP